MYFVYIITNIRNNAFYIGVTNNLLKRIFEHKTKLIEGFSSKYNLSKLVYYEDFINIKEAISREKQLKNWHHDWKLNLIRKKNAEFRDLYEMLK